MAWESANISLAHSRVRYSNTGLDTSRPSQSVHRTGNQDQAICVYVLEAEDKTRRRLNCRAFNLISYFMFIAINGVLIKSLGLPA